MAELVLEPGIDMIKAFKRDPRTAATPTLDYVNLEAFSKQARSRAPVLMDGFWEAEAGSLQEESLARNAAIGNLVLTGLQLQQANTENKQTVADRFTEASIELYGQPEIVDFQKNLHNKIIEFSALIENPLVEKTRLMNILDTMEPFVLSDIEFSKAEEDYEYPAKRLAEALMDQYSDALEAFDRADQSRQLSQSEIIVIFQEALSVLAVDEPLWADWQVVAGTEQASEVDLANKLILVGTRDRNANEAKQNFCHEVLIHALRSLNGSKTGDPLMEYGLPGVEGAEEGVAVFTEYGFSRKIPISRSDRYVDFGMAMGYSEQPKLSRQRMQQLYVDRSIVRKQAKGQSVNQTAINQTGWREANRIYRGTVEGEVVSVNAHDLAYYFGFYKIADFTASQLSRGVDPKTLLNYLLKGKFDPTNASHKEYIARFGIVL